MTEVDLASEAAHALQARAASLAKTCFALQWPDKQSKARPGC